jgi:ubiquinone/menaquinone biosynthesis C-methylase UbiE
MGARAPLAAARQTAADGPACPVCGCRRAVDQFQARDHHYGNAGAWREKRCTACGSFFLDPLPSEDELLAMYPKETYYSFRLSQPRPWRDRLKRWLGVSHGTREPAFARPGRMLDFGCGAGEFLLRMREAGWQCAGVEVSDVAVAVARGQGLHVEPSLQAFSDAHFDYVRANHSLEHVPDPRAVLQEMYRVLKPGGTLFIGVPTNDGQNARLFGPYWWYLGAPVHPVTFSTRGLADLVMQVGFAVERTTTNSDFASTAGSLQIFLNRRSPRRSSEGIVFRLRPLLVLGHWVAKLQDLCGIGDKLELVARKPAT